MPFYGPLLKQGLYITSDWMDRYSLGSKIVIAFLFAIAGGVFKLLFDLRSEQARTKGKLAVIRERIGEIVAGVVLGPIAVIALMFIVSTLYYTPSELLQKTAEPFQRQVKKEHSDLVSARNDLKNDNSQAKQFDDKIKACRNRYDALLNEISNLNSASGPVLNLMAQRRQQFRDAGVGSIIPPATYAMDFNTMAQKFRDRWQNQCY
jgi:hypothetical protein